MWDVIWSKEAKSDYARIDHAQQKRISNAIKQSMEDPPRHTERLKNVQREGKQLNRLRVGDYRIVVTLDRIDRSMLIMKIGHRRNVYDF